MITEEEGKLIRKVELTEEEIRAEIASEEDSIKETLDRIDMYKTYLPVEEVSEDEANDMISKHCDEQGITMEKFFDERETEDKAFDRGFSNMTSSRFEEILSNGIAKALTNYDVKVKS